MKLQDLINFNTKKDLNIDLKKDTKVANSNFSDVLKKSEVKIKNGFENKKTKEITREDNPKSLENSDNKVKNMENVDKKIKTDDKFEIDKKVSNENSSETKKEEKVEELDKKVDTKVNEKSLSDSSLQKFENLFNVVSEEISKILNVSVNEVKEVLNDMNVKVSDLTDVNKIKELMMKVSNVSDEVALLNDIDSANKLKALVEFTKNVEKSVKEFEVKDFRVKTSIVKENILNKTLPKVEENKNIEIENALKNDVVKLNENVKVYSTEDNLVNTTEENLVNTTEDDFVNSDNVKKEDVKLSNDKNHSNSISFDKKIENVFKITEVNEVSKTEVKDIINQIVEKMKFTLKDNKNEVTMTLNPERLGKVSVQILSENGELTAKFRAENNFVKEIIEANIASLKQNFESQDIKVHKFEVSVFTGNEQKQSGNSNNKNSKQDDNKNDSEIKISSDSMINDISENNIDDIYAGSNLSFSA